MRSSVRMSEFENLVNIKGTGETEKRLKKPFYEELSEGRKCSIFFKRVFSAAVLGRRILTVEIGNFARLWWSRRNLKPSKDSKRTRENALNTKTAQVFPVKRVKQRTIDEIAVSCAGWVDLFPNTFFYVRIRFECTQSITEWKRRNQTKKHHSFVCPKWVFS